MKEEGIILGDKGLREGGEGRERGRSVLIKTKDV